MPELPEVQTIVSQLQKTIPGLTIRDIWSDWIKTVQVIDDNGHLKISKSEKLKKGKKADILFNSFKDSLIDRRIEKIERVGKNILIYLSGDQLLLVHQKMSGHLLLGEWSIIDGVVSSKNKGIFEDKINGFIHLIFYLSDGSMLALSDLRKFAKAISGPTKKVLELPEITSLGPDALDKNLTFEEFRRRIKSKKSKIKVVLLDQKVIAGIGNIYADESLWSAKIHPEAISNKINDEKLKKLYNAMREILSFSIEIGGDSMSDFRNIHGKRGGYQEHHKVYQREGEDCYSCGQRIKRIKIAGRSSHYCNFCQKKLK